MSLNFNIGLETGKVVYFHQAKEHTRGMRVITVRAPFEHGYIEAFVHNLSYGGWRCFVLDPRKKTHAKYKFWAGSSSFGDPYALIGSGPHCWHGSPHFASEKRKYELARKALKEAIRRWMQRYVIYGELGNTAMPLDPDLEALWVFLSTRLHSFMQLNPRTPLP